MTYAECVWELAAVAHLHFMKHETGCAYQVSMSLCYHGNKEVISVSYVLQGQL